MPPASSATARDGSRFPFDHFPGIIRMWKGRCGRSTPPVAAVPGTKASRLLWLRCRICGRSGRFIDPFPRIPRTKVSHLDDQSGNPRADSPLLLRGALEDRHDCPLIGRPSRHRSQCDRGERFHRLKPLGVIHRRSLHSSSFATLSNNIRDLRATRLYQMIRDRGYSGSVVQLRRTVARLRPHFREPFLQLHTFAGEQAQVDWAHFGHVMVGRARRALSCFVMTLSYSRALYLEFFFDQTMENFLRGHVHAFRIWPGQPRVILYDNLKSAVLERRGNQILFHPRLIELSAHYHFAPRPCQVRAGNQKGRVERAIRYVRDSFWAGRTFTTLAECNRQALLWRDQVAHQRRWPGGDHRTVGEVVHRRTTPLAVSCAALLLHRPGRDGAFAQDHLCSLRSQQLLHPARSGGQAVDLLASDTTVRILDGSIRDRPAYTHL